MFSLVPQTLSRTIDQVIITILGSLLSLGVIILFVLLILSFIKRWLQTRRGLTGTLLLVSLPMWEETSDQQSQSSAGADAPAAQAEQMFSELHGLLKVGIFSFLFPQELISFEIVATHEAIKFYVFCSHRLTEAVINTIQASYPEADIQETPDYQLFTPTGFVDSTRMMVSGPLYAPIRTYENLTVDPLNSLTNKMASLESNEALMIQFIATPAPDFWRRRGFNYLNKLQRHVSDNQNQTTATTVSSLPHILEQSLEGNRQVIVDQDIYKAIETKLNKSAFSVVINCFSVASSASAATANLQNLTLSFAQFNLSPLTTFVPAPTFDPAMIKDSFYRTQPAIEWPWARVKLILNTQEFATIFHFPSSQVTTPRIHWLKAKKYSAPTNLPTQGLHLGYNDYRGIRKSVFIKPDDRRRHLYILGQTGTGKTELMKYMIYQDIIAGNGVCYIDPHGDAVEDLLTKIPPQRIKDVIYFNPADTQRPPGLNILEGKTNEEKNIIVNSFIALLYKLYDPNHTGIMGPMLERAVRNVMLTAMEEEGNTLIEVLRLLTSPDFAKTKIPLIKDPVVKTYWTEELAQTSDFHKSEMLGYFVSKFDHFVTDVTMRNIIGQSHSAFNFREVMDQKKILLINLAKGKIGEENSSFLGLLLIPRILIAAMSRYDLPEESRPDFYLYVDEFQNFATSDFVQILSESRKFRLNLSLANQYLEQIPKPIKDALFGNVGTLGAFRVGTEDAEFLKFYFKPVFSNYDLANNMVGNLYIKMLIDGLPSAPFSLSLDWGEVTKIARSEKIRELITKLSRIRYGEDKAVVEQDINRRSQLNT